MRRNSPIAKKPNTRTEYDALADVYDQWVSGDPAAQPCENFYLSFCIPFASPILELGVGTGRIALRLAGMGKDVIGVDQSARMLKCCRKKARDLNVAAKIQLIRADLRDFSLSQQVELAIFPMRSLGHLLTPADRCCLFTSVCRSLRPGGRFVFDHYVFDKDWAQRYDRVPRLMYFGALSDRVDAAIWDSYIYSFEARLMSCCITVEKLRSNGMVYSRMHYPLSFSWTEPAEIPELARESGFQVESLWGDFNKSEFGPTSCDQVWVLRKPLREGR